MCVCVCVCACVRARACVRASVCGRGGRGMCSLALASYKTVISPPTCYLHVFSNCQWYTSRANKSGVIFLLPSCCSFVHELLYSFTHLNGHEFPGTCWFKDHNFLTGHSAKLKGRVLIFQSMGVTWSTLTHCLPEHSRSCRNPQGSGLNPQGSSTWTLQACKQSTPTCRAVFLHQAPFVKWAQLAKCLQCGLPCKCLCALLGPFLQA